MHNLSLIEKRSVTCRLNAFSPQEMLAMKSNKQLIYVQRCQIYALKKTGLSQIAIAKIIEVSQSTISRELKRNTGLKGYRPNKLSG